MSTAVYVVYATHTLDLDWIPDDVTIVVVHNDDVLDRTSLTRDVVHVDARYNVGFGAGVNLALDHATGARVVLCNPDLGVSSQHWHAVADSVDEKSVVTIPLLDADGQPTTTCSRYPTPCSHLASGYRVGRWLPRGSRARAWATRALGSWGRAQEVSLRDPAGTWSLDSHWVSGTLLSVATTRIRAVGGFDDSYFLYYEDVDLCRRLADAFPEMDAVVADIAPGVHAVGGTADGESTRVERIRLDSAVRFASRHPGAMWQVCASLLRLRQRSLR